MSSQYLIIKKIFFPLDKKWTKERCERWLQAFTANIDLLIDVE